MLYDGHILTLEQIMKRSNIPLMFWIQFLRYWPHVRSFALLNFLAFLNQMKANLELN